VFPVRYELNSYILLRRNSVFKGLTSQTLRRSAPLCCSENKDSKLTAHDLSSTVRQILLLGVQPVFPLESGGSSPLQVKLHTGLFEDLLPHTSFDRTKKKKTTKNMDIKLLTR
jgi:hypothetical protein